MEEKENNIGYYTYHEIELIYAVDGAEITKDDEIEVHQRFEYITEYSFEHINGGNDAKWYDREVDMINLSKEFPNIRFDISSDGEESDDNWEETWINWKCHHRDMVFTIEPFNIEKLK